MRVNTATSQRCMNSRVWERNVAHTERPATAHGRQTAFLVGSVPVTRGGLDVKVNFPTYPRCGRVSKRFPQNGKRHHGSVLLACSTYRDEMGLDSEHKTVLSILVLEVNSVRKMCRGKENPCTSVRTIHGDSRTNSLF